MDKTIMWLTRVLLQCFVLMLVCYECSVYARGVVQQQDQNIFEEANLKIIQHRSKRKIYLFDVHSRKKWPTTIPFYFQPNGFTPSERSIIRDILHSDFEQNTCLTFEETSMPLTDRQFIYFRSDGDPNVCSSYIGLLNDTLTIQGQPIYLHDACFALRGSIIFSVASTLGMHGEQQRPDRDQYIDVLLENISPDRRNMYSIFSEWQSTAHGVPYDYGSAMHLSAKDSLASNATDRLRSDVFTSLPKDVRSTRTLGQRSELSFFDIQAINEAYCADIDTDRCAVMSCQNGGYPDLHHCRCNCPDGFSGDVCQDVAAGSDGCVPSSGVIELNDEEIHCANSPGYNTPLRFTTTTYDNGDSCTWILRAPVGKRIKAWFTGDFYMASLGTGYTSCLHWVELKHEGSTAVRGPRYCNIGNSVSPLLQMEPPSVTRPITSAENEMMVIFKAPDYRTHHTLIFHIQLLRGFNLCYQVVDGNLPTTTIRSLPTSDMTTGAGPLHTPDAPDSGQRGESEPSSSTSASAASATTPAETQPGEPGAQTQKDADSTDKILIIGSIIGGLLLLLILLVLLLLCCVCRRKKKQQPSPPPTPSADIRVAYINPGYETSNTSHVAQGVQIDIIKKKDPEDLDYSYVATPGALPSYEESPPEYEEVGPKPMETYEDLPSREENPILQNSANDARHT